MMDTIRIERKLAGIQRQCMVILRDAEKQRSLFAGEELTLKDIRRFIEDTIEDADACQGKASEVLDWFHESQDELEASEGAEPCEQETVSEPA